MPSKPSEDVPAEMWMQIFESINNPVDLHSIILTCRRFYSYALRSLHRNVVWENPREVASNLPSWDVDPHMAGEVQTLEVQVSTLFPFYPVNFYDRQGNIIFNPRAPENGPSDFENWPLTKSLIYYNLLRRNSFATDDLYQTMINRILTFTNMHSLTFRKVVFSDRLFGVIHALPALRKLHLELCLFPGRNNTTPRNHAELQLTDLTLLNLRRRVHHIHGFDLLDAHGNGHQVADMDDDITHVLELALAPNLRSLHIDSTADVLGRVFCLWNPHTLQYNFNIPQNLERLYITRKKYVDGEVQPQFMGEQFFPDRALYALFNNCTTLTHLALAHQLPRHSPFPPNVLSRLRFAEGTAEALMIITPYRPSVIGLSILHAEPSAMSILGSLSQLSRHHPNLEMLAIECGNWDDEIMHAVCQLFPALKRLKITYLRSNGPSEDTIVSFGPHFLSRLKHLRSIAIHEAPRGIYATHPSSLFDPTFQSIADELKEFAIPWNRYCPELREVQLHAGWKITRGYDGGQWNLEKVKFVPNEDLWV
ncbi:hypothetical protein C8Q75DRAFT_810399 [Abortiporus biennis]|nr:hypothetical protein C8Q75DRAFT_810399 [Abortiporus biennis]